MSWQPVVVSCPPSGKQDGIVHELGRGLVVERHIDDRDLVVRRLTVREALRSP